jgi:hypothetical protein
MTTDPGRTTPATTGATGRLGGAGGDRRLTDETKHAFKTTEFFAYVATSVAGRVAAMVIGGDGENDQDNFQATQAWLYVTILTFGYLLSRGIAKSGSRHRYWDDDGPSR